MLKKRKILIVIIVTFFVAIFAYGCFYLVQYSNGNTSSQKAAYERQQKAQQEADNAVNESQQWFNNRDNEFIHDTITVKAY